MRERRFVLAAFAGNALASAVFLTLLDDAIVAERWGRVLATSAIYGLFMALWNSALVHLDQRQRSTRNVIFEHAFAQLAGVLGVSWGLAGSLDHVDRSDLVWYTIVAIPLLALAHTLTRKQIKGEDPRDLFQ